jgi:DNA-binding transcriptional LysR family regulator
MALGLRQLEQLVALAEEGHIGRAAARLGMAQPPLSQALQRMESALGFKLFDRSKRPLALTAAGQTLLRQARPLLGQMELAERLAARVASGEPSRLRVAFSPWSPPPALPAALKAFRRHWPGVEIRVDERKNEQQVDALRKGILDVGIINLHRTSVDGLETRLIERSALVAAVPAAWPLGKRKAVHLADLADLPWIMFPRTWSPNLYGDIIRACEAAGFTPNVVQRTTQIHTMISFVASEVGVALADEGFRGAGVNGVSFIPIVDLPGSFHYDFRAAWVPRGQSPVIMAFVECLENAASRLRVK